MSVKSTMKENKELPICKTCKINKGCYCQLNDDGICKDCQSNANNITTDKQGLSTNTTASR